MDVVVAVAVVDWFRRVARDLRLALRGVGDGLVRDEREHNRQTFGGVVVVVAVAVAVGGTITLFRG